MTSSEDWIRVFAPATVANVGPGFDCFGFALVEPGDTVWARASERPGVRIIEVRGDGGALPTAALANTAGRAAMAIWDEVGSTDRGLELIVEKGLPLCSGLGSSAASAVAGAVAAAGVAKRVTGIELDQATLLEAALAGEQVASGDRHADNVAPSLLGGFTIVQAAEPLHIARLEPALPCHVAVVTPRLEISTRESRAALPKQVPLGDAVANWANTASMVLALVRGESDLLRRSLRDHVVEPHRAAGIVGFVRAREQALATGAYGCSISGSGPTVFALTPSAEIATAAAAALTAAFEHHGLASSATVTSLSLRGAREL